MQRIHILNLALWCLAVKQPIEIENNTNITDDVKESLDILKGLSTSKYRYGSTTIGEAISKPIATVHALINDVSNFGIIRLLEKIDIDFDNLPTGPISIADWKRNAGCRSKTNTLTLIVEDIRDGVVTLQVEVGIIPSLEGGFEVTVMVANEMNTDTDTYSSIISSPHVNDKNREIKIKVLGYPTRLSDTILSNITTQITDAKDTIVKSTRLILDNCFNGYYSDEISYNTSIEGMIQNEYFTAMYDVTMSHHNEDHSNEYILLWSRLSDAANPYVTGKNSNLDEIKLTAAIKTLQYTIDKTQAEINRLIPLMKQGYLPTTDDKNKLSSLFSLLINEREEVQRKHTTRFGGRNTGIWSTGKDHIIGDMIHSLGKQYLVDKPFSAGKYKSIRHALLNNAVLSIGT